MLLSYFLIIFWVVFSIYGDYHLKQAAAAFHWLNYAQGCLVYALCSLLALVCFRRMDFGTLAIIWSAVSLAASVLSSVIVFHEPISVRRSIAFALVAIAIAVMGKEV